MTKYWILWRKKKDKLSEILDTIQAECQILEIITSIRIPFVTLLILLNKVQIYFSRFEYLGIIEEYSYNISEMERYVSEIDIGLLLFLTDMFMSVNCL
jgi:hypothetical protein